MKTAKINLYSLNELNEQAKENALIEHANFLVSIGIEVENENGEIITEYPHEITREEVVESIEINEYLFFYDGTLAGCTTYTGGHVKSGITELKLYGEIYTL